MDLDIKEQVGMIKQAAEKGLTSVDNLSCNAPKELTIGSTFGGDSVHHPSSVNRHHLAAAKQHIRLSKTTSLTAEGTMNMAEIKRQLKSGSPSNGELHESFSGVPKGVRVVSQMTMLNNKKMSLAENTRLERPKSSYIKTGEGNRGGLDRLKMRVNSALMTSMHSQPNFAKGTGGAA